MSKTQTLGKQLVLRKTLEEIAKIEQQNNFLGVRFSLRDSGRNSDIFTEDVAEHVLETLRETVEISQRKYDIPISAPCPPETDSPSEFTARLFE